VTSTTFDPVSALESMAKAAKGCDDERFGRMVIEYVRRCRDAGVDGPETMRRPEWRLAFGLVREAAKSNDRISGLTDRMQMIRDVLRGMKPDDAPLSLVTPGEADPTVLEHLVMGETRDGRAKVMPVLSNIIRILAHDPRWSGRIRYNEFRGVVELDGETVRDVMETAANVWIADHYGIHMGTRTVAEALASVADANRYHPVREWLCGLEWDHQTRLTGLLCDYFGAADTPLHRVMALRWMLSAVARVMPEGSGLDGEGGPGCKADAMIVLYGTQGRGKSTALRVLCGAEWFKDSDLMLGDKDAYSKLRGAWIYEIAEIDGWGKREASEVKAFLSSREDSYRPAYARHDIDQKRQCVFAGTTNHRDVLKDPTGARRFWPVEVGDIDIDALARDREQLWAEAVYMYAEELEQWWMTPEEDSILRDAHEDFRQSDAWEPLIESWSIGEPVDKGFPLWQIAQGACGIEKDKLSQPMQTRLKNVLKSLGWTEVRRSTRRGKARLWVRGGA